MPLFGADPTQTKHAQVPRISLHNARHCPSLLALTHACTVRNTLTHASYVYAHKSTLAHACTRACHRHPRTHAHPHMHCF
eukprot:3586758-Pleurochrysis_carterae.AAC.1